MMREDVTTLCRASYVAGNQLFPKIRGVTRSNLLSRAPCQRHSSLSLHDRSLVQIQSPRPIARCTMSSASNDQDSHFKETGKRPYVQSYVQKPSLNVGDKVYLLDTDGIRKGPFLVASLPSKGKCTLGLENGSNVKNGAVIDVNDVEAA